MRHKIRPHLEHPVIRIIEFILLCLALPSVIIIYRLAPHMFMFLWGAGLYALVIYFILFYKGRKALWRWEAVNRRNLQPILIRWVAACVFMMAFMYLYDPERLFNLLNRNPEIIPFLLLAYPVLSALPQEFIFCTFFFERYAPFFTTDRRRIIASAVVFAFAHMLFINWVAPVFSFVAGLIFAMTYAKTRSLALVTIEHGLYGNALFLIGLGWYFYGGAVQ